MMQRTEPASKSRGGHSRRTQGSEALKRSKRKRDRRVARWLMREELSQEEIEDMIRELFPN